MLAFGATMLEIGVAMTAVEVGFAMLSEAFADLVREIGKNATGLSQVVATMGTAIGLVVNQVGAAISGVLNSFANVIESIGKAAEASGSGMQKFADGIATIVGLKLVDLIASLGATAKGIADIAANAKDMDSLTRSIYEFGSVISPLRQTIDAVVLHISEAMSQAVDIVRSALTQMQEDFASVEFVMIQYMALPHFKLNGRFDAKSGSVPKVSVDWYAKAAEQGAIFSSPQLIGVGDASQPEMLVGEQTLYDKISQAVGDNSGGDVYVYIGEHQLDAIIKRSQKRTAVKSGVR
jgi:hypothetical protein